MLYFLKRWSYYQSLIEVKESKKVADGADGDKGAGMNKEMNEKEVRKESV